jgi:hypothetical protein
VIELAKIKKCHSGGIFFVPDTDPDFKKIHPE